MEPKSVKPSRTFLGHKGRCFEVRANPFCSNEFISASEDGTSKIWNIATGRCTRTLTHNKDSETLRACFAGPGMSVTAGSDSTIKLWQSSDSLSWSCSASLRHEGGEEYQVYVCEPDTINQSSAVAQRLLTGAENDLVVWDLQSLGKINSWKFFDPREECFGGAGRNPDSMSYVFDSKWHPSDHNVIGAILSDGDQVVLDSRSPQQERISMSDGEGDSHGHATSMIWTADGLYCLVSYGSGEVAVVDMRQRESLGHVKLHGAPCYGIASRSAGKYVSWASDSTLRTWSVAFDEEGELDECLVFESNSLDNLKLLCCCAVSDNLLVCGGEEKECKSFLGTPLYLVEM